MSAAEQMDQPARTPIAPPPNFPVTWEHPGDEQLFWMLDRLHCPDPLTPMSFEFARYCYEDGVMQAYALPFRISIRRINTYLYETLVLTTTSSEEMKAEFKRAEEEMRVVMGRLADAWATEWLPEVKEHLRYWESFDLRNAPMPTLLVHLDETIARAKRLWLIHFQLVHPLTLVLSLFDDLYRDLFETIDVLEAYRLLQGFDNRTLAADRALWNLSRTALRLPRVRRVLEKHAAADVVVELEETPEGRQFLAELQAYLNEYGERGDTIYELSVPSWIEDPRPVIENLKGYITQPDRDQLVELQMLAADRERLVAEARERLRGYPKPVVDQFEFLLKAAQEATILSEDHNFWIDYRSTYYQPRRLLLEFGCRFAGAGVIETPDDIFYLTPDELRETAAALPISSNRRMVVGARRAEMEYFRTIFPPPMLGTLPPGPLPDTPFLRAFEKFVGAPPPPSNAPNMVRGNAGSPGTVCAPARVIRSLAEAGKLQPGEVLVAESTQVPWTPLFAIAAAVVTDTGGILCHSAVVAREYGIPAVVGTGVATEVIRDGQMLEVDGSAGVVRIV